MKVVQNWYADGWMVVQDDWGEQRETAVGGKFRYEPIPICRVNTGFGRTLKEAEDIANRICRLLNDEEAYYAGMAEAAEREQYAEVAAVMAQRE